jgi:hypothetical protein
MGGILNEILSVVRDKGWKSVPRKLWYLLRKPGLRKRIFQQYGASPDHDVREVLAFLNTHPSLELPMGITPPCDWTQDYRPADVVVERDSATDMLVASVNQHRVFFPRNATLADVQQAVCVARMEQDPRSPHCYLSGQQTVDPGDVAVLVGASDGIFCLSLIERISKAYLFEPNPDWAEPLRATMKPWGNKVEIVPLALGAKDSDGMVRLDSFLTKRSQPNFLQMDVEGAEHDVLMGAWGLLQNKHKLRLSICTYHKRLDYSKFSQLLGGLGYHISHSPGYYVIGIRMPYLRRGVLYASRGTLS